jgi:Na+/phosphate symporter
MEFLLVMMAPFVFTSTVLFLLNKRSIKLLKAYLIILGVGIGSALFPFLLVGVVAGFPAVLIASGIVIKIFEDELS